MTVDGDQRARVVIVGGGFGGLGMGAALKRDGIEDFVILERHGDVGGVWHANTYPGLRCDVPSHLYSFSFAPNPEWSATYSPQPEIRDYLRRCADRLGLRPHLRTHVELREAVYDEATRSWLIETSAGRWTADVLIAAMGPLTEPKLPDVPGLARFEGKVMHSARWDHDYPLAGRRVASVGTGASAIQYVPEIADEVDTLYVLQRTPPWVLPHGNRPITGAERRLYRRLPAAQRLVRGAVYGSRELLLLGFAKRPQLMALLERVARRHMERQIDDPRLRAQLTPHYRLGCKRIVPSNRWYRALARPNVELVSAGLAEVREHSIVDDDGTEREVDAIILGTGFHVTDIPFAGHVRGRGGELLIDHWRGSPRAYLGSAVPGFPNFFALLGPNTGLGHSSMIYMIESQIEHIRQAIGALTRRGAGEIEVTAEAHEAYNRALDARMRGTVWETGGCASWYFDSSGRNAALWPDWTWRFRRLARRFDEHAYRLGPPLPGAAGAGG